MATGLQTWSQTAANNANADTAVNWAEGQAPSSVNDSARAMMAAMAKWRDDVNGTLSTTGSSAAFTVSSNQVSTGLTAGYMVAAQFHATCDSSATLAIDSLTAKPIQIRPGVNVSFGQIRSGSIKRFTYSSTGSGQWILHGGTDTVPGDVVWSSRSANSDELTCDGAAYSRTTYADLFAAIGTVHGSSDSSTFNVPDIAGRTVVGKEASATRLTTAISGFSGATLGAVGGDQNMQSHNHATTITDPGHTHSEVTTENSGAISGASGLAGTTQTTRSMQTAVAVTGITAATTTAGTGTSQNVQPSIVLNAFIKI